MVVAGVYLVARTLPLFELVEGGPELVLAVGLLTTFLSAFLGLVMTDIKRVVAYSTINSLGLMFVALGMGAPQAAMLYLFAHAFFKAMLFLDAGSVIHATEQQTVDKLGGLWNKMPITGITFAIGALSMAGVPVLAGFWAKDEILTAALDNHGVFALLCLTLPVTALYMGRVFILTFLGQPKDEHAYEHAHESPPVMTAPLLLLGVLTVVAGFVVFDGIGEMLGFPGGIGQVIFLHEPEKLHIDWAIFFGSTALVLAGLIGAWYAYVVRPSIPEVSARVLAPVHRLLVNKYYLDDAYQYVIDNVVLGTARLLAWFDRNVVNDTGINGPGEVTGGLAFMAKFQQTGKLPNYALAMIVGVVAITAVAFGLKG
jgi:NADH-quinone oxidoreductase subunit L